MYTVAHNSFQADLSVRKYPPYPKGAVLLPFLKNCFINDQASEVLI